MGRAREVAVDRSEGFGERLLGALLDRVHEMLPQLIAPLVAEEAGRVGGRDVCILLQDYGQRVLRPLPGRGLVAGEPELIDDSVAGRAFLRRTAVEEQLADGVRMYLPLLDGSDEVGVLALTLDAVDEDDRRLLRRLAGLAAGMLVTKNGYTDQFIQARRGEPMTLAAEIQWALLPPMTMITAQVALAGILEPAYGVAGDSFDYAINDNIVHLAVIDAMGHGLNAALLATLAISAYRHARRANVGLADLYGLMDAAIDGQFGPDQFVTAQMMHLDIATGHLQWVNAGHPAPLLIRDRRVVSPLESPTTLPAGFGGATPQISEQVLRRGDRVLFSPTAPPSSWWNGGVAPSATSPPGEKPGQSPAASRGPDSRDAHQGGEAPAGRPPATAGRHRFRADASGSSTPARLITAMPSRPAA
jgi:stage II sporulation SpoE-like protein